MNGDACVSSHVRLERAPYHRKAGNDMGNDMDKKGMEPYQWNMKGSFFL